MKKYYIRDQKGSLHYIKAKNLSDAMKQVQLADSFVKDGKVIVELDESTIDKNDFMSDKKTLQLQVGYNYVYLTKKSGNIYYDDVAYNENSVTVKNRIIRALRAHKIKYKLISCTDSVMKDEDEIEYLSNEEKQAIEDYKEAIKGTTDLKLLKLYAHILQEEIEHLEELQNEDIEGE